MSSKPNIIFVVADEFRQQSMGFMKQDPVITPNIDRFAKESLVLTNAVSTMPMCSPYRGMLFTGMYPYSNGIIENVNSMHTKYGIYLKEDARCISDVLAENNYNCGYVGKYHLDAPIETLDAPEFIADKVKWDAFTPPSKRHGFDFWYSYGCCDEHMTPHYWTGDGDEYEGRREHKGWSPIHELDIARDYIKNSDGKYRDKDKPFALFWSINPPHMPFEQVPETYKGMYNEKTPDELLNRRNVDLDGPTENTVTAKEHAANYFAAVSGVDEQFGKLMQYLEEEGLKEDTIVVFTSDHGEMMGSHDLMGKSVWYDEAFLIPFIIRWPDKINHGVSRLHLAVPDVMPTLLSIVGLEDKIPEALEGTDYAKVLTGEQEDFSDSAFGLLWKAPYHKEVDVHDGFRVVRTDQYTYAVEIEGEIKNKYLYDNVKDPYQMTNLIGDKKDIMDQLDKRLILWMEKTNDPWLNLYYKG